MQDWVMNTGLDNKGLNNEYKIHTLKSKQNPACSLADYTVNRIMVD